MRRPVSLHASRQPHERAGWRPGEGSVRRGGRLRRAKRSAAGTKAWTHGDEILDAGRSAFVTPKCLPAASARAGRVGLAKVAVSSALPPSEDGGAGRKNGLFPATRSRGEGDCRVAASLRAKLLAACELTLGAGCSIPQPARRPQAVEMETTPAAGGSARTTSAPARERFCSDGRVSP
jgi:hypothetical protein